MVPAVTPDGQTLFFLMQAERGQSLWMRKLPGGQPKRMLDGFATAPFVSPDGKTVLFLTSVRATDSEALRAQAWVMWIDGSRVTHRIDVPRTATVVRWNADGTGIAYIQTENVWVQPFDGGKPRQITHFDDQRILDFRFSPDGQRLAVTRTQETSDIVLVHGVK